MTRTSPLFRDPVHDGAADPKVVWNRSEGAWWMVYTSRRCRSPQGGVAWVHGSGLGVASSIDHGGTWTYRGLMPNLETEWGTNTFWAPEIVFHDGRYHMFVSYIRGVPDHWPGPSREIRHYASPDLLDWSFLGALPLSSDRVIDAAVHPLPGGGWRLWYKDEAHDSNIWAADSDDLFDWSVRGPAVVLPFAVEGPDVFRFAGTYWMLVDAKRQLLLRSDDLDTWQQVATILDVADGHASGRPDDVGPGLHASTVVADGRVHVFYFTHPDRHRPDLSAADHRRSSIFAAVLTAEDGELRCTRDASVSVDLSAAEPV